MMKESINYEAPLIPREVLFGNPEKLEPRISPDGNRIAYLAPCKGVLNIWLKTIGKDDDKVITDDKGSGIRIYFVAHDNRHILYLQDSGGNENFHLYGVDLVDGSTKDYTPFENVQAQVLFNNKHFPNELLIILNKENPKYHDVYHLDLTTGNLELRAKNPGNVLRWFNDTNMKTRGVRTTNPDGGSEILVRKDENSKWEKIISWDSDDLWTSFMVGFSKVGKEIYVVDSRYTNTGQLVKMDIESKKIEVIASDPQYDITGVIKNPDSYEIQAATILKERKEYIILDKSIEDDVAAIKKIDHGDFSIINRDHADETWLISFEKDNGPISYYAFDRRSKKATFLFDHRPNLKRYTLSSYEPVSFRARDGLTIHGYITFPPGKEKKNLPMVMSVHGGPWWRENWGFHPEAQWHSNRGYFVFHVNFRGSIGYGKEFVNAGDKEWAGKMHDDIVDAVNWAIEKGWADPKRIAIFGGSYGGYGALVGATFTPDLFCCAVDLCGPSNLISFLKSTPAYWSTFMPTLHKRLGNPETDEEFLKSRSPFFKVDQIKIPMLIAQGANDPRVKQAESEQIVEAMKAKGIEYEYLLFPDEGHGLSKPENRFKFYAAAEKFLAKHLGGRYEE
jgi:dipeptidyl aminopeptidase/acylaminoacyl peptidase